jgi:transcriptional regulator with XRE-family HTH domain
LSTNVDYFRVTISNMSIGESFVAWLQEEMQKRGWNQSDLAKAAGISRQAVSNILNMARTPGPDVCKSIASAFKIDPAIVFVKAGFLPPKKQSNNDFDELVFLIEQLSPSERQEIEELVRFKIERKRVGGKAKPTLSVLKETIEH